MARSLKVLMEMMDRKARQGATPAASTGHDCSASGLQQLSSNLAPLR
jgi:hypothetical protein